MGDRANIIVRNKWNIDPGDREGVVLYSHWGGYEMPEILREALAKRWRWDDGPYLARVIFDVMTKDEHDQEIGYGISTRLPDNERDLLVLDGERVYRLTEDAYREHGFVKLADCPSISFEDYVSVQRRTWDNLTDASSEVL